MRCDNVFLLYESLYLVYNKASKRRLLRHGGKPTLESVTMLRKTAWIWFVGFAAWLADALISLRYHNLLHARIALVVAVVFFTAGLFYRRQT